MSGARKRMSLLDKMEHIAELEELKDLISDDEEEEEEDEDGSAIGAISAPESMAPEREMMETDGNLGFLEEEEDDDDDDEIEEEDEDDDDEEDDDEVIYTAEDLGYEFQGDPDEEHLGYEDLGYEDQSQFTNSSTNENSSDNASLMSSGVLRRTSRLRASRAGNSYSSAPEHSREDGLLAGEEDRVQRRSTFAGPPGSDGVAMSRRVSSRRSNINLSSVAAPPGMNPLTMSLTEEENDAALDGHGGRGSVLQKMASRTFGSHSRRSTAMKARRTSRATGSDLNSIQMAASKLESGPDSVFAAASVVAQSAATAAKRGHVQFNTDDAVLCMLTLLNVTNPGDDTESFTVSPVNIHGYPPGEGKTEEEKQGPYVFVLATVKKVHFDEDERYYTVVRADNGTEQRADTGWMEPLRNPAGIEAAREAAEKTGRAMKEQADEVKEAEGCGQVTLNIVIAFFALPLRFAMKLIPWYRRSRALAKVQITHLLYGDSSYACRFRLTGINVLVVCSFIFLFFENVKLAFFPAEWDHSMAVIGFIVWCILLFELIFEYLIRPCDYTDLIESEQAYAPSTARHINLFHLIFESVALLLFIPEFDCLSDREQCGQQVPWSGLWASVHAVDGSDSSRAALGRLCLGLTSLRLFGLVRHWKQMWINNTFADDNKNSNLVRRFLLLEYEGKGKDPSKDEGNPERSGSGGSTQVSTEEDQRLKNAATIGTALMVVNSHRALLVLVFIVTVLPMVISYKSQNFVNEELAELLHGNNIEVAEVPEDGDCEYLQQFVHSWLLTAESVQPDSPLLSTNTYVLWARILPVRCPFQGHYGELCNSTFSLDSCRLFEDTTNNLDETDLDLDSLKEEFAKELDIRVGGIHEVTKCFPNNDNCVFETQVLFNDNFTVSDTNLGLFILLATLLILVIFGLTVMRNDAGRLVLDPLRRMLKIVVRYAENPLMETGDLRGRSKSDGEGGDERDRDAESRQLGNYETEQLINAIAKIADLLRKCWGVAGAGIISTNLARTKEGKTVVFNPTVPGKRVYALFGFVAINGFDKQLHALGRDVMILINDVAKVVHDEVFRWALGDSGQCNRNLGAAFLMVFRIGDFNEIHNKKKLAQDVVFNTNNRTSNRRSTNALRKRKTAKGKKRTSHRNIDMGADGTLQLASLPGIQAFTDRALLGMLKSHAGIHRDKSLMDWKKDWRLGAGVGAFSVSVIYGMDAGWAVEGAVGSEYKIDATYLSPHVNMASRMMSATKQYGVTILLSQAVEELLSRPARSKLRHLDTVFVKGSSVAQRIFTYDARHEGVDYFLFERSPDKADRDADAYTEKVWETDQDLLAMRQHVTDEFMERFREGVDQYLDGKWKEAIETLSAADDMMIQTVIEEGYIDFDPEEYGDDIFDRSIRDDDIVRIRTEYGDGACKCLINYMERRNGVPPKEWMGVRKLDSK